MNLKRILEFGYFPKELPPPFETKSFAKKYSYVLRKWNEFVDSEKEPREGESNKEAKRRFQNTHNKYFSSSYTSFSLSKGTYSRRKLGIPNPKQFSELASSILTNWKLIRECYKLSSYSQSLPVEKDATRSVRTKSASWSNFKFCLIDISFDKRIELRLDISQFYPTIYTHSLTWALVGKEKSKEFFKIIQSKKSEWDELLELDPIAQRYAKSEFIDTLTRNCNNKQSVGLCIGPDTSFILAEVIASRIDSEIEKKLKDINYEAVRYYDDYYFYLDDKSDAEKVLRTVQQVLNEYQLETNENKISIQKLPFSYTESWVYDVDTFDLSNLENHIIRNYFNLLNKTVLETSSQSSWIYRYGLRKFINGKVIIGKNEWPIFLQLVLQTLLIDAGNINHICQLLLSYEILIGNKEKEEIKSVLERVIEEHLSLNHSFEVSWSLWIFKSFNIKCSAHLIEKILNGKDSISKIVSLDLISSNLIKGTLAGKKDFKERISKMNSFGENWLLKYESHIKDWLSIKSDNCIGDNHFFKILESYDISFYRTENQLLVPFELAYEVELFGTSDTIAVNFLATNDDSEEERESHGGWY